MLKLTHQDSTFLFPGDIYTAAEREIVGRYGDYLQADVLKDPQHGASTYSSKPFREAVNPQVVWMMHDAIADLRINRNYLRLCAETEITSTIGAVLVSTVGDGAYKVITQFDRLTDFLD